MQDQNPTPLSSSTVPVPPPVIPVSAPVAPPSPVTLKPSFTAPTLPSSPNIIAQAAPVVPVPRKTIFPIILLLITILALGIYLSKTYLLSLNIFSRPTPTPTASNAASLASPSAMPTVNPTANWKTYKNASYGYEIKYPENWTVEVEGNADPSTFPAPYISSPCDYDKGSLCSQILISAYKYQGSPKFDPSFTINLSGQHPDRVQNDTMIKVAGVDARAFEYYQGYYDRGNGQYGRLLYTVVFNSAKIKFTITYEESQKGKDFLANTDWQNKAVFDQILSTFKFTESLISPTSTPPATQSGLLFEVF